MSASVILNCNFRYLETAKVGLSQNSKQMKKVYASFLILVMLLVSSAPVLAQAGFISGQVTDANDGEPLIGANVLIEGTTIGASTDLDGNYRILNVRPGTYTIVVRYVGYQTQFIQNVLVQSGLRTNLDIEMQEEMFEGQEVVFEAPRDVVTRDRTSSEARVSRQQLEAMPVQEVGDVLNLQAGVTQSSSGQIHIRGGRATEVAYIVDGIRVTDDFDRSLGIRLENQNIEELQVVSGAYNAEFGQAMSGIINISTRAGTNNFQGSFRTWAGDYLTPDRHLYEGVSHRLTDLRPSNQYNLEGTLAGPIIRDRLTFFVSGRYFNTDGWFNGRNAFAPYGPTLPGTDRFGRPEYARVPVDDPVNRFGDRIDDDLPWIDVISQDNQWIYYTDSGERDSTLVPLQQFNSFTGQYNLQWNVFRGFRVNLIGNYSVEEGDVGVGHTMRLVPGGISTFDRTRFYNNLRITVTPSANTFFNINAAMRYSNFEQRLFDDLNDPRYFNFDRMSELPARYSGGSGRFSIIGTDNYVEDRTTQTFILKGDITSQLNDIHQIKAGIEFQQDIIERDAFSLQPVGPNIIELPDTDGLGVPIRDGRQREYYTRKPWLLSAFVQDRIEYENLIINAGLRFEYFQSNGRIPADSRDPDLFKLPNERHEDFWTSASPKFQLSPRLGVAYPISETGVIHFSYGYFLQIPEYERLFNGDRIVMPQTSGIFGVYGNPDLKPQQTIQYELGLQQQLIPGTVLEVSGFYRDIRDWISSGPTNLTSNPGIRYGTWVNRDYANVKGVTATLTQQLGRQLNMVFDYTFMMAEGTNSDPQAEFNAAVSRGDTTGAPLTQMLQPLDWDRRHQLNATAYYVGSNWGGSMIARFRTGEPYTADATFSTRTGITALTYFEQNSLRKPENLTFDINLYYGLTVAAANVRATLNVYNLLDTRNVNFVYADSGTADAPLPVNQPAQVDPGYYDNPFLYTEPRRVQFGIEVSF